MGLLILVSFLTFSAQGGWGKEKKIAAKKIASPSEDAAEGGCGGRNSASPERSAEQSEAVRSGFASWLCVSDLAK